MQNKEHHQRATSEQRQDPIPTSAHQTWLDQAVHKSSGQGW